MAPPLRYVTAKLRSVAQKIPGMQSVGGFRELDLTEAGFTASTPNIRILTF